MIKEALKKLDRKKLKMNLINAGFNSASIDTSFSRGKIPVKMSADMERFTSISALFWIMPDKYDEQGNLKTTN